MDSLVDNLHRIHRVITRGIVTVREHGESFASRDEADKQGFIDYARCLVLLILAHHDGEEQMVFPKFTGHVDVETLAILHGQHRELTDALAIAKAATAQAEAGAPANEWLPALLTAMATIEPCWRTHIALEEKTATQTLFDGVMAAADQIALLRALSQHGQQNGHIPQLSVAFTLYNLDANNRVALMRMMPPQVTQELMPGPWRTLWAPMQPYLLS